jgi:aerobic C4-dicarboxylate transport protein
MFQRLIRQLWFLVLLATVAGIVLGLWEPSAAVAMKPLADAFINLVRMMIAPVIFCTVVHGIAGMSDLKRAGRVALKALVYFEIITTLALVVGLLAVNVLQPGAGMNLDPTAMDSSSVSAYVARGHEQSVTAFFLHLIPDTLLGAFVRGEVLQVLLVAALFAFGLSFIGERGRPVLQLIEGLSQVFFRMVGFIMWFAPLGAFGSIAYTVGNFGANSLAHLATLIGEFFAVCFLFVLLVFGAIAHWMGVSLWRLLYYIRDEIVIVAATTSSETVLPRIMQKMRAAGCEESVVGLVTPASYSFNLDGTCLYLSMVTVFLAQATHTALDIGQQLTLLTVLLLTSKGAAGVAGAAFIVLAATLTSVGTVPVASIGLVLGIHRVLAEALTFVNLVGTCLAIIVVSKWENAVDLPMLAEKLGKRA